jgi:hypothetical protein
MRIRYVFRGFNRSGEMNLPATHVAPWTTQVKGLASFFGHFAWKMPQFRIQ